MKKIVLIVLAVIAVSCTDDFEIFDSNEFNDNFNEKELLLDVKLEIVDMNHLFSKDKKAFEKVREISNGVYENSILGRGNFDDIHNYIELDTLTIITAEYYGRRSYTFKIKEKNDTLYNLVLAEINSEEYELMLARYSNGPNYTADSYKFVMVDKQELMFFSGNIEETFTQNSGNPDTSIEGEQICPEGFCCNTSTITSPATGFEVELITGVYLCNDDNMSLDPDGGGGPTSNTGADTSDNGGNSENGQNGTENPVTPPTGGGNTSGAGINSSDNAYDYGNNNSDPVDYDGADSFDPDMDTSRIRIVTLPNIGNNSAFLSFYNSLTVSQLFIWNSISSQQKDAIKDFLFQNGYSDNAINFALELLEIMEGNLGLNISLFNTNDLDFIVFDNFEDFYNSFDRDQIFINDNFVEIQNNTLITHTSFVINQTFISPCVLNVLGSLSFDDDESCYSLDSIDTSLSGFTTMYEFQQSENVNHYVDGDYINVYFIGTLTTGIKINGYGIFFNETLIFDIKINRLTGSMQFADLTRL